MTRTRTCPTPTSLVRDNLAEMVSTTIEMKTVRTRKIKHPMDVEERRPLRSKLAMWLLMPRSPLEYPRHRTVSCRQ